MFKPLDIQSHNGSYRIAFVDDAPAHASTLVSDDVHFLVDERVAALYGHRLEAVIGAPSVLLLKADEHEKSLDRMPSFVAHLVKRGFKRNHRLVAMGGGVIQDISCFLAATMMRGVDWLFFPTTLLAQADSCMGSKSSINVGDMKNIVGTFTPPREVFIDVGFLATLDERDVRSGVGEILKVHAIDGPATFNRLVADYERLFVDRELMVGSIYCALSIKKPYVEADEFDRGIRQIFNYGHSFGHAVESATNFAIPHGIAVTMGMDVANFVSWRLEYAPRTSFEQMHASLKRNYRGYESLQVPIDRFMAALSRDKKNSTSQEVTLILPGKDGHLVKVSRAADTPFVACCEEYFATMRN